MRWPCSSDEREHLADAIDQLGKFSALTADSVNKTKENLVKELKDLGPVLESLANAGPALTRSLSLLATFPLPNETLEKWLRGDYGNLTAVIDLTLSRLDAGLLHRHPLRGQADRAGNAVGPHHRPAAQPVHRRQPAGRALPLRSGAVDMRLSRRIKHPIGGLRRRSPSRLATIMAFGYMRLPAMLFGIGQLHRHRASCREPAACIERQRHLPRHRGRPGRSQSVLTDRGVEAELSLKSDIDIPSDLDAAGAQPDRASASSTSRCCRASGTSRAAEGRRRHRREDRTSVPPDINTLARRRQPRPAGDPHGTT